MPYGTRTKTWKLYGRRGRTGQTIGNIGKNYSNPTLTMHISCFSSTIALKDTPVNTMQQVAKQSLRASPANGTCTHRLRTAHDKPIKALSPLHHSNAIHSLLDLREQLLHPSLLHLLAHGLPQLLFLHVRPPPLADASREHRVQRLCPLNVQILGRTRSIQGHKDLHAGL
jgi:hypothetical protein